MLRFALFGAGRIGRVHAGNLARSPRATLACVFDVDPEAAARVSRRHGGAVAVSVADALDRSDAVIVASSTDSHVSLIEAAVAAGRPVLCEKPIDLDLDRATACAATVAAGSTPVQIGFNRRYDPHHRALRDAVQSGDIGDVEMLLITSRDPAPPPPDYVAVSGGLFRDMMIHDFDMARFVLGEEPVSVAAAASVLVDPVIAALGDVDTAMVILRTASGRLCHIDNSRRAVYGYDQRIEAFGSAGMLRSGNPRATTLERASATATGGREPLLHFFLERYAQSYEDELADFVDAVLGERPPSVSFDDGVRALRLAAAAETALRTGRTVTLDAA